MASILVQLVDAQLVGMADSPQYVVGALGNELCPSGSTPIEDMIECLSQPLKDYFGTTIAFQACIPIQGHGCGIQAGMIFFYDDNICGPASTTLPNVLPICRIDSTAVPTEASTEAPTEASTDNPTKDSVLLFQAYGSSSTYKNNWHGWYSSSYNTNYGDGKYSAYSSIPVERITFSIGNGQSTATIEVPCQTLLDVVLDSGLNSYSSNSGYGDWAPNIGHARYNYLSTTGNYFDVRNYVTLGEGDGASDSNDWALFAFESGRHGDWDGNNGFAIGGESVTEDKYKTRVQIFGTPCKPNNNILLFQAHGTSSTYKNNWPGWYSSGYNTISGDGKYSAYSSIPLERITFSIDNGQSTATIEVPCQTLLDVVRGSGLNSYSSNSGYGDWTPNIGHARYNYLSTTGNYFDVRNYVTLGEGDGASDSNDWALFAFESGRHGDWDGNDGFAIGSESVTEDKYKTRVQIFGTRCTSNLTEVPTEASTDTPQTQLLCSNGYRSYDWTNYLSGWSSSNLAGGSSESAKTQCWKEAKRNVPNAVGIFWQYNGGSFCRAIDNINALLPWQSSYPNSQYSYKLCIDPSQIPDPTPVPTETPTENDILLFQAYGSSSTYKNNWHGWYSSSYNTNYGDGKYSAYSSIPVERITFSIGNGQSTATIEVPCQTLLDVVLDSGLDSYSSNSGYGDWTPNIGHARYNYLSTTGNYFDVRNYVTLGEGDGASDSNDWALFAFESGRHGDWDGNNGFAIGGESVTEDKYKTRVQIFGTPCKPNNNILLFQAYGSSSTYKNNWPGWYSYGYNTISGDGKYSAYSSIPLERITFSIDNGQSTATIEVPCQTLLDVVRGSGLNSYSSNSGYGDWRPNIGHARYNYLSTTGNYFDVRNYVTLGEGDGASDPNDWALFAFESGRHGDWDGNNGFAIGGESVTEDKYKARVQIFGSRCKNNSNQSATQLPPPNPQGPNELILLAINQGYLYFKVRAEGVMSSQNIIDTCQAISMQPVCSGSSNHCIYNDASCVVTPLSISCVGPMEGVSKLICNGNNPTRCGALDSTYNYMKSWNGGYGCGVEGSFWCTSGRSMFNKYALCVMPPLVKWNHSAVPTEVSTDNSTGDNILLFQAYGSSRTYKNNWHGWYSNANNTNSGDGKYSAYSSIPLERITFSIGNGQSTATIEVPCQTLLDVVLDSGLNSSSSNNGTGAWAPNIGHARYNYSFTTGNYFDVRNFLTLGEGDGDFDPNDWALFAFMSGAHGDWNGNNGFAIGGESVTEDKYKTRVQIWGTPCNQSSLQPPPYPATQLPPPDFSTESSKLHFSEIIKTKIGLQITKKLSASQKKIWENVMKKAFLENLENDFNGEISVHIIQKRQGRRRLLDIWDTVANVIIKSELMDSASGEIDTPVDSGLLDQVTGLLTGQNTTDFFASINRLARKESLEETNFEVDELPVKEVETIYIRPTSSPPSSSPPSATPSPTPLKDWIGDPPTSFPTITSKDWIGDSSHTSYPTSTFTESPTVIWDDDAMPMFSCTGFLILGISLFVLTL